MTDAPKTVVPDVPPLPEPIQEPDVEISPTIDFDKPVGSRPVVVTSAVTTSAKETVAIPENSALPVWQVNPLLTAMLRQEEEATTPSVTVVGVSTTSSTHRAGPNPILATNTAVQRSLEGPKPTRVDNIEAESLYRDATVEWLLRLQASMMENKRLVVPVRIPAVPLCAQPSATGTTITPPSKSRSRQPAMLVLPATLGSSRTGSHAAAPSAEQWESELTRTLGVGFWRGIGSQDAAAERDISFIVNPLQSESVSHRSLPSFSPHHEQLRRHIHGVIPEVPKPPEFVPATTFPDNTVSLSADEENKLQRDKSLVDALPVPVPPSIVMTPEEDKAFLRDWELQQAEMAAGMMMLDGKDSLLWDAGNDMPKRSSAMGKAVPIPPVDSMWQVREPLPRAYWHDDVAARREVEELNVPALATTTTTPETSPSSAPTIQVRAPYREQFGGWERSPKSVRVSIPSTAAGENAAVSTRRPNIITSANVEDLQAPEVTPQSEPTPSGRTWINVEDSEDEASSLPSRRGGLKRRENRPALQAVTPISLAHGEALELSRVGPRRFHATYL